MKAIRLLACVILFCLMVPPLAAAQTYSVDPPRIFRLKNGMTVLVKEDARFPLASVRLYVKAGSAWEKPEEAGLSHFLEHLVFRGSRTNERGVDQAVENAGGYLNAYTSFDNTVYLTDLPSDQWKVAVRSVRDLGFDPLLQEDDFAAEKEVVLAEMKQRGDQPFTALFNATFAAALKGTPYESPIIGYEDTIRASTTGLIRDYIKRRYDPRDMLLAVAGKVSAAEVVAEAETLFGAYPNLNVPELFEPVAPEDLTKGLQVEIREGPWNKAYVSVSFPIPGMGAARLPAADILARMLGGDDTSLLSRSLRIEKALVDHVSASALSLERAGLFMILAVLDDNKVEEYLEELLAVLAGLSAEGFSAAELNRAKLNLEDNFWRSQETIPDIVNTFGNMYFFDPSDPAGMNYLTRISDVDTAQIQQVIKAWLKPEAMTIVAVTPKDGARDAGRRGQDIAGLSQRLWPQSEIGLAGSKAVHTPGLGQPEIISLDANRQVVLWQDDSLPYVSATMSFAGGGLFVDPNLQGLSQVAASVLTSATENRNHQELNAYLSDRAAGLGASSRQLDFSVSFDAPARFSADIFVLFRDILTRPAFNQEDLDRVKREQSASIINEEEDVVGLVRRNLQPFLFKGGNYGQRLSGDLDSVARIDMDAVRAFWEKQRTQPWVMSVVGSFDREEVLAFAGSLPIPQGGPPAFPDAVWNTDKELTVRLPGREQAAYAMIFPAAPLPGSDSPAISLLSASLGGFGGLLYQELREKRSLGYSVAPIDVAGQKYGILAFYIIAGPDKLDEAKENFVRIARQLHEDLLPEETIARAKAMLEANYHQGQQSRASRADSTAYNVRYGYPLDFSLQRLEEMKKLTAEDLRAAARKYLHPEEAYSLKIVP